MESCDKYCNCLYFSANALSRVLTRLAEESFASTGLSPSHAFVLMRVNEAPGIQPTALSGIMQLSPSTVTRLVEKLESKGLVTRHTTGKTTAIFPTDASQQLQYRLQTSWKSLYTRYAEVLGADAAKQLTEATHAARVALES